MQLLAIPTLIAGLAATADAFTFTWKNDFSADFKIGDNFVVEWEPVKQKNDLLLISVIAVNNTLTWAPPDPVFGFPGHWYNEEVISDQWDASLKKGSFTWPIQPLQAGYLGDGYNYTFDVTWDDYATSADHSDSPIFHIYQ
ncbi:hypothetical protein F4777DRAFT_358312 [Nemania sp. FL0916]|nr:hypothetical protein F4777DRAFT_358312 [Nemania sp. FL0916]